MAYGLLVDVTEAPICSSGRPEETENVIKATKTTPQERLIEEHAATLSASSFQPLTPFEGNATQRALCRDD